MSSTIADLMHTWYSQQLGHDGSLIELEREYFGATASMTWADAALVFYAGANGSSPVGSLNDEAFKYYSGQSGLTPPEDFSLSDHIYHTFASGAGHSPIPLANMLAWFESDQLLGAREPNLLTSMPNQIDFEAPGLTSGWASAGAETRVSSTIECYKGAKGMTTEALAVGELAAQTLAGQGAFGVKEGDTVTGMAYCKMAGAYGSRRARVYLQWRNAQSGFISNTLGANITLSTGWTAITATAVAPAGTAEVRLVLAVIDVTSVGEIYIWDNAGVWLGPSTEWRDSNGLPADGTPVDLWLDLSGEGSNKLTVNQATSMTNGAEIGNNSNTTWIAGSTDKALDGTTSAKVTVVANGNWGWGINQTRNPPTVVGGKTYTFLASINSNAPADIGVGVWWYDSGGAFITGSYGVKGNSVAGQWVDRTLTVTAPSNAVKAAMFVECYADTAGAIHYIDCFSTALGYSQIWQIPDPTKVAYDLTQATPANRPLFRSANPNMLTYSQATIESITVEFGAPFNGTQQRVTTEKYQGAASLEFTCTGPDGIASPGTVNVTESKWYTVIAYVKTANTPRSFTVGINWQRGDGSEIAQNSGPITAVTAGTWTKLVATIQAPAEAATAKMTVWNRSSAGGTTGDVFYVDSCSFVEGASSEWLPPVSLANGQPVIQQAGVMRLTNSELQPTKPFTMYVVGRQTASGSGISYPNINWGGVAGLYINPSTGQWYYYAGSTVNAGEAGGITSLAAFSAIVKDAGQISSAYRDSIGGTPADAGAGVTTGLFATSASGSANNFEIVAILIYKEAHSDSQRQLIEDYLMNKYGISSEPTLNPLTQ